MIIAIFSGARFAACSMDTLFHTGYHSAPPNPLVLATEDRVWESGYGFGPPTVGYSGVLKQQLTGMVAQTFYDRPNCKTGARCVSVSYYMD